MIDMLVELERVAKYKQVEVSPLAIGLSAYDTHKEIYGSFKYAKEDYARLMNLRYDYCVEQANKSIEERL
jgi:hypothetical protein